MKKYFALLILSLGVLSVAKAQTAVATRTVSSPSAVLDFATGTTKGIILPAVETMPANPANGTFLFDKTTQIVKMFQNGIWINMTGTGNASGIVPYTGTSNEKQTIMGARSTKVLDGLGNYVDGAVDGVLVLESPNKALVLPQISNPHLTVKSPYAGMMCYDTNRKAVAVFDGTLWNYWK